MGSIPPALDFDHQPFTTLSWQKHQQVTPKPLAEEYPIESLGLALAWVGSAAKQAGFSATFHDSLRSMMQRLNEAKELANVLDVAIIQHKHHSANELAAATWLQQYFHLPKSKASLPQFLGLTEKGERFYEVSLPIPAPIANSTEAVPNPLAQSPEPTP